MFYHCFTRHRPCLCFPFNRFYHLLSPYDWYLPECASMEENTATNRMQNESFDISKSAKYKYFCILIWTTPDSTVYIIWLGGHRHKHCVTFFVSVCRSVGLCLTGCSDQNQFWLCSGTEELHQAAFNWIISAKIMSRLNSVLSLWPTPVSP